MLKKSLIAGAAVALLMGLFLGRDVCSYVGTSAGWLQESVKDSVPVNFELERARHEIAKLDPVINRAKREIATEEVQVDRLARQIHQEREALVKKQGDIHRLSRDLKSNDGTMFYGGRRFTIQQVKADLTRRFENYKVTKATCDSREKVLLARQAKLEAARQKLEEMMAKKLQFEVEIENLAAQQKMVEVAQTVSDFHFDDSQLARTKKTIDDIRTRIEVAAKLVDADSAFHAEIPLDEPAETQDITETISEYFGEADGASVANH